MKYYFFLDETGDHGLSYVDENFLLFLLCGILLSERELQKLQQEFDALKQTFWNTADVIFHSRDIRKLNNPFQIFFDLEKKKVLYECLNEILQRLDFQIIVSAIKKNKYIKTYGKTAESTYEIALSSLLEEMVLILSAMKDTTAEIWIEKRGKKEDADLLEHFNKIYNSGTFFLTPQQIQQNISRFLFRNKTQNDVEIQLADLAAYPIARHILSPQILSPSFAILQKKIYKEHGQSQGLIIFP